MVKAFSFINPIGIKGLEAPSLSREMMYLLTMNVEEVGKVAILRQLSRLFEIDIEALLQPLLEEKPPVSMNYDPFQDDWEFIGDRNDKLLLEQTYQLAKSMQTGDTDDETEARMSQEGWSSTKDLKEDIDKMLQLIVAYPFFWRAIKYGKETWLKPYFEEPLTAHSSAEKVITAFTLDIQELVQYIGQLNQYKQLWFAKCY